MAKEAASQHCVIAKDLKSYIKGKIKMLERDFRIYPTKEELAHFQELKTEIAVDNYALTLIMR